MQPVTIRLHPNLLDELDVWRGRLPRSEAIRMAIERLVKTRPPKG